VIGEAADGASGLASARELRPQLVLLDVRLPDIDGFIVAGRLADQIEPPLVVLTSSRAAVELGERLERASVAGFIHKDELSVVSLADVVGAQL
jgi:DNA-binding NarL/FixJ family response regulator